MGWRARIVVSSAMLIAGCAALAGLDGPTTDDDPTIDEKDTGTRPGPGGEGGGGRDSSTPVIADSGADTEIDPIPDGAPDVANCTKTPYDGTCSLGSECCTTKCNEQHRCKNNCKDLDDACDPFSSSGCCVGLYCSPSLSGLPPSTRCKMCRGPDASPDNGLDTSCCSRNIQNGRCM